MLRRLPRRWEELGKALRWREVHSGQAGMAQQPQGIEAVAKARPEGNEKEAQEGFDLNQRMGGLEQYGCGGVDAQVMMK